MWQRLLLLPRVVGGMVYFQNAFTSSAVRGFNVMSFPIALTLKRRKGTYIVCIQMILISPFVYLLCIHMANDKGEEHLFNREMKKWFWRRKLIIDWRICHTVQILFIFKRKMMNLNNKTAIYPQFDSRVQMFHELELTRWPFTNLSQAPVGLLYTSTLQLFSFETASGTLWVEILCFLGRVAKTS